MQLLRELGWLRLLFDKAHIAVIRFYDPLDIARILKLILLCVAHISRMLAWPEELHRHNILIKHLQLVPKLIDFPSADSLLRLRQLVLPGTLFQLRLALGTLECHAIRVDLRIYFLFHAPVLTLQTLVGAAYG